MSDTAFPPPDSIDPVGADVVRDDRWRPTRAGLIALWRFWDETFSFHNGRLLLRGPNGSGKSMALELLLPFLLDANASPHRLTSAAKSRGGLYERIMTGTDTTNRAGFAWTEFRRGHDVFTIGVRLRASSSTRKVDADFFTTTLAVGDGLHLLDDQRVPISRQALVEAIGTTGRVHGSGEDHRLAVAETLFPGFGPDRYGSVISALLALRKEKLSQNLDVAKLSEILSEALPPLDEHDLATVAEGFERLDRRREELAQLDADVREVSRLGERQRTYARALVAARVDDVRHAESTRDDVTRREREALTELAGTEAQIEGLATEQAQVTHRIRSIDVAVRTLRASDVVEQGKDLDAERQLVTTLQTARARAELAHNDRVDDEARLRGELDTASARVASAQSSLDTIEQDLRPLADRVGAQRVVAEARELLEPIERADDSDSSDGSENDPAGPHPASQTTTGPAPVSASAFTSLVQAWIDDKRASVREVRTALDHHGDSVRDRDAVADRVAADESDHDMAIGAERTADAAVAAQLDEFAGEISVWVDNATSLGVDAVRAAVSMPVDEDDEVERLRMAVVRLRTSWSAEFGSGRERLDRLDRELDDEQHGLVAERDDLAAGRVLHPPTPAWRSDRTGRAGAPLWWLVDFASVSPGSIDTLDGVEAALAASGLLDAWIAPDGAVTVDPDRFDVVLGARPAAGSSLADVLVAANPADAPATGSDDEAVFGHVPADVITTVLASIPIAAHVDAGSDDDGRPVVVGLDGSFRMGPAFGRAPATPARYLGAGARERRRLERLAELAELLADLEGRRADVAGLRGDLERRDAAVRAELDAAPTGRDLNDARSDLVAARSRLDDARVRIERSRRDLSTADDAVRTALRDLTNVGVRLGLPTTSSALDTLVGSLDGFADTIGAWARRFDELGRERVDLDAAHTRLGRAFAAAVATAAEVEQTVAELSDAEQRLDTLMSTIGQDYQAALARIDALEDESRTAQQRAKHLGEQRPPLDKALGKLEATVAAAESDRATAELNRAEVHDRFVRLVGDGLVDDADLTGPAVSEESEALDGVTGVLATARSIADELTGVERTAAVIDRLGNRVVERLHEAQASLAGRVDFDREQSDDGWWTLRGLSGGVRRRIADLVATLEHDLAATSGELDTEEEELFEQVLAGDIRRSLAERIRSANGLLDDINAQIGKVKTGAGQMAVRLRWDVDPEQPASVAKARRLLLQDPASLDADQSTALRDFVKSRIEEARVQLETNAPWDARLRATLDYRAWHRFGLEVTHRNWDGFKPATPTVMQILSTGERSMALHLPMLASLAAHYALPSGRSSDAASTCPRLVLLDELFAGVDPDNRAQLFATFTRWDLDAVFTSDHEWCQYADLDGIAIHQLHPTVDDEPVTSTRFTWDGRRRIIDPAG